MEIACLQKRPSNIFDQDPSLSSMKKSSLLKAKVFSKKKFKMALNSSEFGLKVFNRLES